MTFLSNPLNRVLLLVAVGVILGLFMYFTFIQPAVTQYSESQARLAQDQQTYSDLKRVADQKPVYVALTTQIQSRLRGVELTADPRAYVPSYLKQIENLAKADGLQVTSVTPQATPSPSPGPSGAPAPGGTPNPQSLTQIAPIGAAVRAAGASNAVTAQTNSVATATGATPIPGQPGAQASAAPRRGGALQNNATSSARANAIAYLNQSFSQVPINMELSGTYMQLKQFLRDLQKFPKLIGVGSVTLTPGTHQGVGETPTLNIILPIVAYRLSPSQAAGAPMPGPLASPAPGGNGG